MRVAAHRDTPGGPVFLCLWANMWSRSSRPYKASRNCHENGRSETDNGDFQGHKSALILRAACALVQTKKRPTKKRETQKVRSTSWPWHSLILGHRIFARSRASPAIDMGTIIKKHGTTGSKTIRLYLYLHIICSLTSYFYTLEIII